MRIIAKAKKELDSLKINIGGQTLIPQGGCVQGDDSYVIFSTNRMNRCGDVERILNFIGNYKLYFKRLGKRYFLFLKDNSLS